MRAVIDPDRISIVKAGDFKKGRSGGQRNEVGLAERKRSNQVEGDFDANPDIDRFACFGTGLKAPLGDGFDGVLIFLFI